MFGTTFYAVSGYLYRACHDLMPVQWQARQPESLPGGCQVQVPHHYARFKSSSPVHGTVISGPAVSRTEIAVISFEKSRFHTMLYTWIPLPHPCEVGVFKPARPHIASRWVVAPSGYGLCSPSAYCCDLIVHVFQRSAPRRSGRIAVLRPPNTNAELFWSNRVMHIPGSQESLK